MKIVVLSALVAIAATPALATGKPHTGGPANNNGPTQVHNNVKTTVGVQNFNKNFNHNTATGIGIGGQGGKAISNSSATGGTGVGIGGQGGQGGKGGRGGRASSQANNGVNISGVGNSYNQAAASSAYAPSGTGINCISTVGLGVQGVQFGFSFGIPVEMPDCTARENARVWLEIARHGGGRRSVLAAASTMVQVRTPPRVNDATAAYFVGGDTDSVAYVQRAEYRRARQVKRARCGC